jgi:hypothetical protein
MPNEFDLLRMRIQAHYQIFSAGLTALRSEVHELAGDQKSAISHFRVEVERILDGMHQSIERFQQRSDAQYLKMMTAHEDLKAAFDAALLVMSRNYDLYLAGQTDFATVKADIARLDVLQTQIDDLNQRLSALERKQAS